MNIQDQIINFKKHLVKGADQEELDKELDSILVACKNNAKRKVNDYIDQNEISKYDLTTLLDSDYTKVSRILMGRRPFSFPAHTLYRLAYQVLHISCHELFFDEKIPIPLPHPYDTVFKMLDEIQYKNDILKKAQSIYDKAIDANNTLRDVDEKELFYLQLKDFAHSNMVQFENVCGIIKPANVRRNLAALKKNREGAVRMDRYLETSIMMNVPVDYFISPRVLYDFDMVIHVFENKFDNLFTAKVGNVTIDYDKQIDEKEILRIYMNLKDDDRAELHQIIQVQYFDNLFNKTEEGEHN